MTLIAGVSKVRIEGVSSGGTISDIVVTTSGAVSVTLSTVGGGAGSTVVSLSSNPTVDQGAAGTADWRTDSRRGLTPTFVSLSVSTGNTQLVAADATRKVKVLSYVFVVGGAAGNVQWMSSSTVLSGAMTVALNGGVVAGPIAPGGGHWIETSVNGDLRINLTGALSVANGHLSYVYEV